jgi:hypothetical protein
MMQLVRRALLVGVLLLLVSVGTVSADCAWVLWDRSIALDQWQLLYASPTYEECAVDAVKMKRLHPSSVFLCLPDTIDPRGPKGK